MDGWWIARFVIAETSCCRIAAMSVIGSFKTSVKPWITSAVILRSAWTLRDCTWGSVVVGLRVLQGVTVPDLVPSRRRPASACTSETWPSWRADRRKKSDVSLYLFLYLIADSRQNCTALEICVSWSHVIAAQCALKSDSFVRSFTGVPFRHVRECQDAHETARSHQPQTPVGLRKNCWKHLPTVTSQSYQTPGLSVQNRQHMSARCSAPVPRCSSGPPTLLDESFSFLPLGLLQLRFQIRFFY